MSDKYRSNFPMSLALDQLIVQFLDFVTATSETVTITDANGNPISVTSLGSAAGTGVPASAVVAISNKADDAFAASTAASGLAASASSDAASAISIASGYQSEIDAAMAASVAATGAAQQASTDAHGASGYADQAYTLAQQAEADAQGASGYAGMAYALAQQAESDAQGASAYAGDAYSLAASAYEMASGNSGSASATLPIQPADGQPVIEYPSGAFISSSPDGTTLSVSSLSSSGMVSAASMESSGDVTAAGKLVANSPGSVIGSPTAAGTALTVQSSGSASTLVISDTGVNGANLKLQGDGATTPSKTIRVRAGKLEFINAAYSAVITTIDDGGSWTTAGNITAQAITANNGFNVGTGGQYVYASDANGSLTFRVGLGNGTYPYKYFTLNTDGDLQILNGNITAASSLTLNGKSFTVDGSGNLAFSPTTLYNAAGGNFSLATNGKYWNFNSDGSMSTPGNLAVGGLISASNYSTSDTGTADLNTILSTGFHRVEVPSANNPGINYGQLIVSQGNDTAIQIGLDYGSSNMFFRGGNPPPIGTGAWNAWRTVWHSGNLTPGTSTTLNVSGNGSINGGTANVGGLSVGTGANGQVMIRNNGSGYPTIDYVLANNTAYTTGIMTATAMAFNVGAATFNSSITTNSTISAGSFFNTWPQATGTIANGGGGGNYGIVAHANNNGGSSATSCAAMTFIRDGLFGCYFGMDTDNVLKIGGWSFGNVAYRIHHDGLANPSLNGNLSVANGNGLSWASGYTAVVGSGGATLSFNAPTGSTEIVAFQLAGTTESYIAGDGSYQITGSGGIRVGYNSGTANSIDTSGWFRSSGNSGWFNASYGIGIYAIDATYVRTYNNAQMVAADFVLSSDRRLKARIRDFEYRGRLRPVNYFHLVNGADEFGFISQEVQELYPEIVGADPNDGMLNLSYEKITAILSAQLNRTEDDLIALRKEFDDYRASRENTLWKRLVKRLAKFFNLN